MGSGKVAAATDAAIEKLMALAATHADLDKPDSAGRFVGQR
jgi:hypothetical protein